MAELQNIFDSNNLLDTTFSFQQRAILWLSVHNRPGSKAADPHDKF